MVIQQHIKRFLGKKIAVEIAFCCHKSICVSSIGRLALISHIKSKAHIENERAVLKFDHIILPHLPIEPRKEEKDGPEDQKKSDSPTSGDIELQPWVRGKPALNEDNR